MITSWCNPENGPEQKPSHIILCLTRHYVIILTYLKCLYILLEATHICSSLDLLAVGVRYHCLDGPHLEFRRDCKTERLPRYFSRVTEECHDCCTLLRRAFPT